MTTVTQIITDAYRQSNLLAIGTSPTAPQIDEALRYLNRIVKSVFGTEVGEDLQSFPVGNRHISRPSGYPWYNTVPDDNWFVPKNTRLVFNLDSPLEIYLHPAPDDGTRFAVSDPGKNLATNNVTIHGNGATIDGSFDLTLLKDGEQAEWFFRADMGDWKKYAPLQNSDTFPFPEEFDDFFITLLAIRLNPAYNTQLDAQSQLVLARAKSQIRARYSQNRPIRSELALIRMSNMNNTRGYSSVYDYYNPNALFTKGWPW